MTLSPTHDTRHVVLVTSTLDGIGPGRVMANLGIALRPHGYSATLVSTHGPTESDLIDQTEAAGLPVRHLRMRSLFDPAGPLRLARLVRDTGARVVHTRTVRADVVGRAGRIAGARVINNIVNLYPDDSLTWHGPIKGRAILMMARATTAPVDLFVANAHALTRSISDVFRVGAHRVRVVHDGIPLAPWVDARPASLGELGIGQGDVTCFTAARLHQQKGLEDLLTAASKVLQTHPRTHFVIAGEGPIRPQLEEQIADLALSGHVHLLGWREDIASLLAAADLFILPSRFEGLPNAVIEAMAAGVPAVATAVAGTPEIIEHGRTGWLVEPGRPAELAVAISEALEADLGAMGQAARSRAAGHFSVEQMTTAFVSLYDEVTG